jgi:hypothetical protein
VIGIFSSAENPAFIALMLEKGTADEVSLDPSSAFLSVIFIRYPNYQTIQISYLKLL